MANFTPSGTIRIGRVPFDNSYRHTMTFASASAQASYFASVCTYSLSTYKYVRMNNSIKVPYNAENLYTYNYVMYQNANYGTKWFYAFIVGVNYVNENNTELVLQLDVMQTWYFDYTLKQCFVEREHVSDDTIFTHTIPEPSMPLEYRVERRTMFEFEHDLLCLLTTAQLVDHGGDITAEPTASGMYTGLYSAAKMLAFKCDIDELSKTEPEITQYFNVINELGSADAVVDAFTFPSYFWDSANYGDVGSGEMASGIVKYTDTVSKYVEATIPLSKEFNGFVPNNNKLFTSPFCYLEVGDYTGKTDTYMYENFDDPDDFNFQMWCGLSSNTIVYAAPNSYAGEKLGDSHNQQSDYIFTSDITNKAGWVYDVYANWSAQNSLGNAINLIGGVASVGVGLIPGLGATVAALGAGYGTAASLAFGGSFALETGGVNEVASGTGNLAGQAATYDRMQKQPNEHRGTTISNARIANNRCGIYFKQVSLRREYAESIDKFFDMYGYQVDTVKVPNRTGRPNWNYVKCQNSCNTGNVPADQMAMINAIYDSGITFWHTSDVGNYSLDNTIS